MQWVNNFIAIFDSGGLALSQLDKGMSTMNAPTSADIGLFSLYRIYYYILISHSIIMFGNYGNNFCKDNSNL